MKSIYQIWQDRKQLERTLERIPMAHIATQRPDGLVLLELAPCGKPTLVPSCQLGELKYRIRKCNSKLKRKIKNIKKRAQVNKAMVYANLVVSFFIKIWAFEKFIHLNFLLFGKVSLKPECQILLKWDYEKGKNKTFL